MPNIETLGSLKMRPRTVVLHYPSDRTSIADSIREIWNRLPARVRTIVAHLAQPKFLVVPAVVTAIFMLAIVYYYNQFANEIDARLNGNTLDNAVEIVTPPFTVSVGDRLPISELSDYLRSAGYLQRLENSDHQGGTFEIVGNSIAISPGETASNQPGVGPIRIQVDKQGRIVSLTDMKQTARLSSAAIEGRLMASVREGDRRKKIPVQFADIPDNLRNAIVAAEDRRFFSHSGIDWRGVIRALKTDLNEGEIVQGGSTITQQIIKNNFLTSDRTIKRKVKEAMMAVILELRLTKEQIFTHYFNGVYLGHSGTFAINGFGQAAQVYFDKDINELTLSQSAFLAGLICAPNRHSAHRDPARTIERRDLVLDAMVQTEAITQQEADAAKAEPLHIKKRTIEGDDGSSYFLDYVQRFVEARYRQDRLASGNRITTTMDPRLQKAAYAAVKRQTEKLDKVLAPKARKDDQHKPVQAALVALDAHTGEVLAMVGGRSYDESQLNRATDAKRQPGSAFKPFVYATALSSRSFTAASMLSDRPRTFTYDEGRSEYTPSDYRGSFTNRNVTLREALARSLNVPTVELAISTGLHRVAEVAEACGLDKPRIYPSMALGTSEVTPLQLAAAYTAFANGGTALRPTPIRSMGGNEGTTVQVPTSSNQVFSPQVAYLMTELMQGVVDEGTASRLRGMGLKGAIAGKTGTANDGWFVGYTPQIVCVAWVGFDDNRDLRMKASDAALPMWADFMKQAMDLRANFGGASFGKPGGLVTVAIDPYTGCLAGPESISRRMELFISGTEPSSPCAPSYDTLAELTEDPEAEGEITVEAAESEAEEDKGKSWGMVEVCALTGLRASRDCVRTELRTFDRDREPRISCSAEFHRDGRR